jgi:hypothetical protein
VPAEEPQSEGTSSGLANRLTRFFTSIGGLITSVVTLLAAAATLYVTVVGKSEPDAVGPTPPSTTVVTTTSPATTTQAPAVATIAAWRRDANRICADFHRELRALVGRPPATAEEFLYFLQQSVNPAQRLRIATAGLDVPPDRADDIAEYKTALDERDASVHEAIGAWQVQDSAAYSRAVSAFQRQDAEAGRLAATLGAGECAIGPFQ